MHLTVRGLRFLEGRNALRWISGVILARNVADKLKFQEVRGDRERGRQTGDGGRRKETGGEGDLSLAEKPGLLFSRSEFPFFCL